MINMAKLKPEEESSTMDSLNTEKEKAKVLFRHKTENCKEILKTTKSMALVNLSGRMEKYTKDSSGNLCSMAKGESYIPMAKLHRANGRKTITSMFLQ